MILYVFILGIVFGVTVTCVGFFLARPDPNVDDPDDNEYHEYHAG